MEVDGSVEIYFVVTLASQPSNKKTYLRFNGTQGDIKRVLQ
jgi:hypothetical protein